jgi:hypothetical protein
VKVILKLKLFIIQRLHWTVNQPEYKMKNRLKQSPTRLKNIGFRLHNYFSRSINMSSSETERYRFSFNSKVNKRLLNRNKFTQTTIDDFAMMIESKPVERVKLIEFQKFLKMNQELEILKRENKLLVETIVELTKSEKL